MFNHNFTISRCSNPYVVFVIKKKKNLYVVEHLKITVNHCQIIG